MTKEFAHFRELLYKSKKAWFHYQETGQLDPGLFENEQAYHLTNQAFKAIPKVVEKAKGWVKDLDDWKKAEDRKRGHIIDGYNLGFDKESPAPKKTSSLPKKTSGAEPMSKRHHTEVEAGNEDSPGNPATETSLDPIREIWTRFPNSQTAKLTWIYTQMLGVSNNNQAFQPSGSAWDQQLLRDIAGGANTYSAGMGSLESGGSTVDIKAPKLIKFRMTSPYSIVASDYQNLSEPQWIGYFDSMYQYYHVINAQWTMRFTIPAAGVSSTMVHPNMRFWVYWKYCNYDEPPTSFVVDTTGKTGHTAAQFLTPDDYDRMGGWNKRLVVQNSTHDVMETITGTYNHGDCGMDIKMVGADGVHGGSASAEGWVQAKVVAPFPEFLAVIIVADNSVNCSFAQGIAMGIRSKIDYTVQFKDLRSKYKYPTQSQTIGSTQDVGQYFFRGAGQLNPTSAMATAAVGTYN